jgi:ADP-heptose:LPS heptosyltransferase
MSRMLKAPTERLTGWRRLRRFARKYVVPVVFPIIFIIEGILIALAKITASATNKSVIFVRTDNLGDFILWLPAARALREKWPWPGVRYVLIANVNWAEFARKLNLFDEVIGISRTALQSNIWYRFRSVFQLGRCNAELLITPIHSRDPTTSDTVARAINARRKVAAAGNTDNADVRLSISNRWYDQLVATPNLSAHISISNKEFMKNCLGVHVACPWPELAVPTHARLPTALDNINYVAIAPGAFSHYKAWSPKCFAELADRIFSKLSLRTVLIGTASERNETAAVARACATPPIDLTAMLDIENLLCVLKRSELVITNDTGTAHLGAALRVPTICIVGGGHFGRFLPYPADAERVGIRVAALHHPMPCYHCNWWCKYSVKSSDPAPCVAGVTTEAAWNAVETMLHV